MVAFWVTALIITGVFAILGFVTYIIFANRGYTNKIRIRQLVGDAYRIVDDIAKVWIDPVDRSKKWKCKKTKYTFGLPPERVLSLSPKGQLCAECYLSPTGEVNWIEHNASPKSVTPLETEQRQLIVNEYYKALEKRGKSIWDLISNLAPLLICAVVVIFLMVFYEDMGKPLLAMADKQEAIAETHLEQLKIIKEIHNDIQVIGGDKLASTKKNLTGLTG